MDKQQMDKDLGGGSVFPIGEENTAFAQYFTGECYLNMLAAKGVGIGNVTFAPRRSITGTFTIKVARFY